MDVWNLSMHGTDTEHAARDGRLHLLGSHPITILHIGCAGRWNRLGIGARWNRKSARGR